MQVGFFGNAQTAAAAYDRAVLQLCPSAVVDGTLRLNFPPVLSASSPVFPPMIEPNINQKEFGDKSNISTLLHQYGPDQSKMNSASAFSGSFSAPPRARLLSSSTHQSASATYLQSSHNLAPLGSFPTEGWLFRPTCGGASGQKSSIAHLLDDKSTLERGTPSSLGDMDEIESSITPCNVSVGGYSTFSTPATLPSPSLLLSPTSGCHVGSRSSFPLPRLGPVPGLTFTSHPPTFLQPLSTPLAYPTQNVRDSESHESELEALRVSPFCLLVSSLSCCRGVPKSPLWFLHFSNCPVLQLTT